MDRQTLGRTRLLLSSIVFLSLFFSFSCEYDEDRFTIEFNVIDENQQPLRDVFVTGYRLIDYEGDKEKTSLQSNEFGLKRVDCVVPSLNIQTFDKDPNYYNFFMESIRNYQIVKLRGILDKYFGTSEHLHYYFDWKKTETIKQHEVIESCYMYKDNYELNIPSQIALELLEQQSSTQPYRMVAYEVPVKYYLVFRKLGYDMQSAMVGATDKDKRITIQLHKESSNPHLEKIHKTIRRIAKERWTTSESSENELKEIILQLEKEREYAEKNGYVQDARALKQYVFTIPIDNVEYVVVGEHKPRDYEKLRSLVAIGEQALERDPIDIGYFDWLIRKIDAEYPNQISYRMSKHEEIKIYKNEQERSIDYRLKRMLINYFEYLDNHEIVYPFLPNDHVSLVMELNSSYDTTNPETEELLQLMNILARQSLKANPFQSAAWEAYILSYERLRTDVASEECGGHE